MARYRKKPVVIEAVQLTANNIHELAQWCGGGVFGDCTRPDVNGDPTKYILIGTLEGGMAAYPGDWIIKGVKGEFYPCKPDIFQATYEAA